MMYLSIIVPVFALALSGCTDSPSPNSSRNALAFNQNVGPGFNPNGAYPVGPQGAGQANLQRDLQTLQASRQALANLRVEFEWPFFCFEFGDDDPCMPELPISSALYEYRPFEGINKQQMPEIRKHLEAYANIALNSPISQAGVLNPFEARRLRREGQVAQNAARLIKARESMEKMFEAETQFESYVRITHRSFGDRASADARLLKGSWKDASNPSEKVRTDMNSVAVSLNEYRNLARHNADALQGIEGTQELVSILTARAEAANEIVLFLQDRTHENIKKMSDLSQEIMKRRAQTSLDSTEKKTIANSEIEVLNIIAGWYKQYEQLVDDMLYDEMSDYSEVPNDLKGFYRTLLRKKDDAARQIAFIHYRIAESDAILYETMLQSYGITFSTTTGSRTEWFGPEVSELSNEEADKIVNALKEFRGAIRRMQRFGSEGNISGHIYTMSRMVGSDTVISAATDAQNLYSDR